MTLQQTPTTTTTSPSIILKKPAKHYINLRQIILTSLRKTKKTSSKKSSFAKMLQAH